MMMTAEKKWIFQLCARRLKVETSCAREDTEAGARMRDQRAAHARRQDGCKAGPQPARGNRTGPAPHADSDSPRMCPNRSHARRRTVWVTLGAM
jgi:hypothetical protein